MPEKKLLTPEDMTAFEPEAKVGLLATVDESDRPHITLITTIRARSPEQLMWGQFSEGCSKRNVRRNPKTGFLVLTMDKRLWRGRALWTHTENAGPDFDLYNHLPMFRYNAYFGIHTVHYMNLVDTGGKETLPMAAIVCAALAARVAGGRSPENRPVLTPWARETFNQMAVLKFLAHVPEDGFPRLIPIIQCRAPGRDMLALSCLAYGAELRAIAPGAPVAVFALTMKMESVLVRGTWSGPGPLAGGKIARISLDWVYNSMPPKQGQIYPPRPLRPVVEDPG